jgi:hypothetical protein
LNKQLDALDLPKMENILHVEIGMEILEFMIFLKKVSKKLSVLKHTKMKFCLLISQDKLLLQLIIMNYQEILIQAIYWFQDQEIN